MLNYQNHAGAGERIGEIVVGEKEGTTRAQKRKRKKQFSRVSRRSDTHLKEKASTTRRPLERGMSIKGVGAVLDLGGKRGNLVPFEREPKTE